MKKRILFVQELLAEQGLYQGKVDGIAGPVTLTALDKIKGLDIDWSTRRKIIGFIQLKCFENEIDCGDIDGYWGPQTEHAYEQLLYQREHNVLPPSWRPEERKLGNTNNWPVQYSREFYDFYGEKGQHLKKLELPYQHKLSWNLNRRIRSFYCHKKVHDSLQNILTKVYDHYGHSEIKRLRLDQWGGCYNERAIRGGTKWSMHSWGIAVDYDPAHNKLKWGRDKADFARNEYNDWWSFWEEEGWVSLGRERNFDWMHVQAARLF